MTNKAILQRNNAITDDKIPQHIAALKEFIGAERIGGAQQLLDEELRHHVLARRYLLKDRRPGVSLSRYFPA